MKKADYIIIDFDSTFISKESLDMLAEACLKKHKNRHKIIKQVQTITDQGMSGKIDFRDSLDKRISRINLALALCQLNDHSATCIMNSVQRNLENNKFTYNKYHSIMDMYINK